MTNKKITDDQIKDIKEKLLEEKDHLQKELEKIGVKNPKVEGDYDAKFEDLGDDETENVSEVEKYSLDKSLEVTLEKALRDTNKALDLIKKGDYGLCKYCKQPINPERLKARPTSSSCIACKTKLKSL